MENPGDLFNSMVKEAMEEVGNHGWRDASQNAVTLAAFGMLVNKIDKRISRIAKPAWIIALSAVGTAIFFVVSKILGL